MVQRKVGFFIFLIIVTSASAASAGLVLRFEAKKPTGEPSRAVTFMLEGQKLRVEDSRGGIMIFDGDQQRLWTINSDNKTYSEVNDSDISRIRDMREKMKRRIEKQMERLPPEQQMELKGMLKQMSQGTTEPPRELTFKENGTKRKTKDGFSCRPFRVMEKGLPIEEICFIVWAKSGFSLEDFQAFDAYERFLTKIGANTTGQNEIFFDLKQSPGIPAHVAVVSPGNRSGREQALTLLKRKRIPTKEFTPPLGFQKKRTLTEPEQPGR
ncbi:MAG: hypothetical protein ACE5FZ_09320 [Nitrospiria bacterium]